MNPWSGKAVFITGVCGTVGRELLRRVLECEPGKIVGIDNNESELFLLEEEHRGMKHVRFFIADIRDRDELARKMHGADVVLHAAALKHVLLCERSPRDAVHTNISGTQSVIDAAIANRVQRVIFTSSDKAVNPTNVMGASKLMAERLMTAANALRQEDGPIFASTRFGNVLGSRGSVVPLFLKQIQAGGPVTLTDASMTRFVMTLPDAAQLVVDSVFRAKGGEVFVTKMHTIRIEDLAHVMIEELAPRSGIDPRSIELRVIGSKPGEKLYEELLNTEEVRRTLELDKYFVIVPAFTEAYGGIEYSYSDTLRRGVDRPYNSAVEKPLGKEALRSYLRSTGLLN